jgi:hypothetical protein
VRSESVIINDLSHRTMPADAIMPLEPEHSMHSVFDFLALLTAASLVFRLVAIHRAQDPVTAFYLPLPRHEMDQRTPGFSHSY